MNKQITLYIGGTKQRQAGFTDLVIIGVFPEREFKNMDRVTLIAEKPVWSIKHTSDYILYQLIDRRVKSFDADAPGVLSIAMTIPNDMQLADGKSPYTLLKTVYDKFRNEYMIPYSDGRDSFSDIKVEKDAFQEIVAQYLLESRKDRYVVMTGTLTGTLCVTQDKMEDLFRDSQYAEFANYKDIEIGSSCATTIGLELLEIPRPVSYEILINGIRQSVSLSKPSDGYTTRLNDTEDYKYQNISFTLGDLLASENGIYSQGASSVKLDKENRRILCNIQKVEIRYKGTLKLIGKPGNKDVVQRAVENGDIRIDLGNYNVMDYQTSGLEFEIPSRLLKNPSFSITPNKTKQGFILSVMPSIQIEQQAITIELAIREEEKKVVTPPVPVTRSENKNGNNSSNFNKQSDKQKDQDDAFLVEERKRQTEERRLLIRKWFIIGFLSSLLFCSLGFGAYLMFKKEESQNQLKEQIAEKDNKIQELERENKKLKDDNGKLNDNVKILNDSIVNLKNKIKPSRDGIIATSDSNAKKKKNVAQDPKTMIVELIKEGKSYDEIQSDENFSKLKDSEQWAITALFLQTKGLTRAHKIKIKKEIPEIKNGNYANLTWRRIIQIQVKIGQIMKNNNE